MSADKNHEQYLEQIETAVAETTMDILEKRGGDLRAMAKLVAEKQVEINRLKEYQDNDRKTIRNLRKLLKECNSEREQKIEALRTANRSLKVKLDNIFEALDIGEVPDYSSYEDHADEACERIEVMMLQTIHKIRELEEEVKYHKETAEVGVGLANSFRKDIEELKEKLK